MLEKMIEKTNHSQPRGLIRLVESEEDKIAGLKKKVKIYAKLSGGYAIVGAASSAAVCIGGAVLLVPALGLLGAGAAISTLATQLYSIYKSCKAKEQLKGLYEKK